MDNVKTRLPKTKIKWETNRFCKQCSKSVNWNKIKKKILRRKRENDIINNNKKTGIKYRKVHHNPSAHSKIAYSRFAIDFSFLCLSLTKQTKTSFSYPKSCMHNNMQIIENINVNFFTEKKKNKNKESASHTHRKEKQREKEWDKWKDS